MTDRSPNGDVDVCIIGSGFGGTFVASALIEHGYDVVVLEAGPRFDLDAPGRTEEQLERAIRPEYALHEVWEMDPDRDRYRADVPSHVDFDLNDRRVKGVGGTSLSWHGTVMRLLEKDFEMRSRYGVGVDWPLTYEDLSPYYDIAEREIGVAGRAGPLSPPRDDPFPMEAFPPSRTDDLFIAACERLDIRVQPIPHARNSTPYDGREACEGYATCTPFCPTSARYVATMHLRRAEEAGVRIVDQAFVQRLEHNERGDRVTAAVYRTPDGEEHRQHADVFVAACGPVETPRLLLLSASRIHPDGLANSSGTVGRYFQATPYISTTARLDHPAQPTQTGFDTTMSYEFYEPEDEEFGSIWLVFRNENPTPVIEQMLQGGARHVRDTVLSEVTGNPWGDELLDRVRKADTANFSNLRISSYVEPMPMASNRVTLDRTATDRFGQPIPRITYRFDARTARTMQRALDIHRSIFEAMDVEIIREESPLRRIGDDHKGTTRMGDDASASVVDANGRTHDIDNLWIAGASVFPTGGALLPALTVIALALKTADHIHDTLND